MSRPFVWVLLIRQVFLFFSFFSRGGGGGGGRVGVYNFHMGSNFVPRISGESGVP